MLALQGVGYLVRKAIGLATVTIKVNEYEAPPSAPNIPSNDIVTHLDTEQSASGLTSTHEKRCLDNVFREHTDWLFGALHTRSRWVSIDQVADDQIDHDWEIAGTAGHDLIMTHAESVKNGWIARQLYGFQKVDGDRRYCCQVTVSKGSESVAIRLVYDYVG